MIDLRKELIEMKYEFNLTQKIYCTDEEKKAYKKIEKDKGNLPDGIKSDDAGYYRYVDTDLTKDEIKQLMLYRQISYLNSIKNSMAFFVILTIISIILSLLLLTIK